MKEIEDINAHIYNLGDENLGEVDFEDRIHNLDEGIDDKQEGDDWEYLKKTITKEGRYMSDDFVKYHQITDQLVDDEDDIVNGHMDIIKVYIF
jgi:hypothetical protein